MEGFGGGGNAFWINEEIEIGLMTQGEVFAEIRDQRESLERRGKDAMLLKAIGEAVKLLEHVAEAVNVFREALFQRDAQVIGDKRSGAALAQTVNEVRPDLVLIDVDMPGMQGDRLVQVIRRQAPESCAVLYSDRPEGELRRLALAAGAAAFIPKSVSPEEFVRRITELLAGPRPSASSGGF